MSGCVTVTGPPFSICERKIGTTEPDEPSTLPNRTETNRVVEWRWPAAATIHSAIALEAPITVCGLTALSVETRTNRLAPDDGGRLGRDLRRHRVVANRLERIHLHQADVLVGGGVEDDVRVEAAHDLEHPVRFLAVGEHRLAAVKCHCSVSSRSIWKRLSSAWSRRIRRRGFTRGRSGGRAPSRSTRPLP